MNRFSKITIAALAAATLLFAGCQQKKEVVSSDAAPTTRAVSSSTGSSMVAEQSSTAVFFAFDKSDIDAAGAATLAEFAAWLNDNDAVAVTVEGNCDERGSREYNLALGQRRADSVKDRLVANGVDASRIDTVSFGEERPDCKGSGEACWAQNRRADILSR